MQLIIDNSAASGQSQKAAVFVSVLLSFWRKTDSDYDIYPIKSTSVLTSEIV